MHLSQIQEILFIEYKKNGYFDMWNYIPIDANLEQLNFMPLKDTNREQRIRDIAELGLVSTEVTEAIEEVRGNWRIESDDNNFIKFNPLSKECADIIIRTLNFMSRKGFDAEKTILHKNKINLKREKLHGRNV